MASFNASLIPPPRNWQDFEELCTDLWSAKYNSKNTQSHGRTGQRQDGVDIYGQLEQSGEWFGVQCKGKDGRYGNQITKQELLAEVEKAKGFSPSLKTFTLATTAQNDATIQLIARELSESHQQKHLFSVEVKSWDEIQREISFYPEIITKHFSQYQVVTANNRCETIKISQHMPPPRYTKSFFGRKPELAALIHSLENESLIQICGIGGIGKSELLLQAIKECEPNRNVIWCNIEKYHSIDELILALLNIFKVQDEQCIIDNLPLYLDRANVRIIFDGVEQSSLDDIEDVIRNWHSQTENCQFIVTSQVELYSVPSQTVIQLKALSSSESKLLFEKLYGKHLSKSDQGLDELIKFCDGHALTITFASALTKYYGSTISVMTAINKHNSQPISIPERTRHNRHTSLEICLQTAYDFLSPKSKKLLWALSEVPAGIYTNWLDKDWLKIDDAKEAYASLKRWHFIEDIAISENLARTRMLTPIRKFVSGRARMDDPESFEDIILNLSRFFEVWVAAIELNYSGPQNHAFMMARYETELPNLINIIELALRRKNNKQLSEAAGILASNIMPYYFMLGAPEVGAKVIKSVTQLAFTSGNIKKANDLLQQYMSLAVRAGDIELLRDAYELLKHIENASEGKNISAELSLSQAMAACHDNKNSLAEKYANNAIDGFRSRLENQQLHSDVEDEERTNLGINLSYSYGLLGTSLLNQGKADKALKAYFQSLKLQDLSIQSSNKGQSLHQIGKCYSKLGDDKQAIEYFLKSSEIFIFTGMKDYISHSFAELGYSLLMIDAPEVKQKFTGQYLDIVLSDLTRHTVNNFNFNCPLDRGACKYNFRKLIGSYFLLSLLGQGEKLEKFTLALNQRMISANRNEIESGQLSKDDEFLLYVLNTILEFGYVISKMENAIGGKNEHRELSNLLKFICELDSWFDHHQFGTTYWLSAYFHRRLGAKKTSPERLYQFIDNYHNDIQDTLDLFSD
ncbi:hypothetical protein A6E13_11095 [Aliivibrio fischeri]|uniref:NB-ARC domain-containing protein n=1 Tax=Aliivibrio fischeri TaxID=668 RepID=UPI00080E7728|nr:NB-ARC domain-containing protein [Aliivibrio fischeri]OCH32952.1 hypothetical protein A6E13_11095 [Aliivibrio fischeri]